MVPVLSSHTPSPCVFEQRCDGEACPCDARGGSRLDCPRRACLGLCGFDDMSRKSIQGAGKAATQLDASSITTWRRAQPSTRHRGAARQNTGHSYVLRSRCSPPATAPLKRRQSPTCVSLGVHGLLGTCRADIDGQTKLYSRSIDPRPSCRTHHVVLPSAPEQSLATVRFPL